MGSDSGFLNGWKRIVLADRKALVMHGQVTLSFSRILFEPGEKMAEIPPVAALVLETETRMSLFGVNKVSTSTWSTMEEATGKSLVFREIKKGKSTKEYWFREDSFQKIRTRPPEGDRNAPQVRWETFQDERIPYILPDGTALPPGTMVHDSYALLYLLTEADLSGPGGSVEFVVISKGKLVRVVLRAGGIRENRRKIRDLSTGENRWLQLRERELLLAPGEGESPEVSFLSMKGEVKIWVEEETHTLLEVSGKIPGVPGRTVLRIKAVEPKES